MSSKLNFNINIPEMEEVETDTGSSDSCKDADINEFMFVFFNIANQVLDSEEDNKKHRLRYMWFLYGMIVLAMLLLISVLILQGFSIAKFNLPPEALKVFMYTVLGKFLIIMHMLGKHLFKENGHITKLLDSFNGTFKQSGIK